MKKTIFILISGKEADCIVKNVDLKEYQAFTIMFLNDNDGLITIPTRPGLINSAEEKKCLVLTKLFNGECKYKDYEKNILEKSLGCIPSERFYLNDASLKHIYNKLCERNYIFKGYITYKIAVVLSNNENLAEFDDSENNSIRERLNKILSESIAQDYDCLYRLADVGKKLVDIRGNIHEYEKSILQDIMKV